MARKDDRGGQQDRGRGQGGSRPPISEGTGDRKPGIIKRLVTDKGFGFIKTDNGQEHFFHRSGCTGGTSYDELAEGDAVTFRQGEQTQKGLRAEEVQIVRP